MTQLKKIFGLIIVMLFTLTSFCQTPNDNENILNNKATTYMSLSKSENCIYFSSMDWFKIVECYDEGGNLMFHANVKNAAKKQVSQFIVLDYTNFEDGEYVIVLKNNKTKMVATLRIFDDATCIVLYDND